MRPASQQMTRKRLCKEKHKSWVEAENARSGLAALFFSDASIASSKILNLKTSATIYGQARLSAVIMPFPTTATASAASVPLAATTLAIRVAALRAH